MTMILDSFPTMRKAILIIAHDGGRINRFESEEKVLKECDLAILFAPVNREELEQIEIDLARCTEDELQLLCIGEEDDAKDLARTLQMLPKTEQILNCFYEAME